MKNFCAYTPPVRLQVRADGITIANYRQPGTVYFPFLIDWIFLHIIQPARRNNNPDQHDLNADHCRQLWQEAGIKSTPPNSAELWLSDKDWPEDADTEVKNA